MYLQTRLFRIQLPTLYLKHNHFINKNKQFFNLFFSDTQFDPCLSNPCKNNGLCKRQGNSFICQCLQWYTGSCCELCNSINDCKIIITDYNRIHSKRQSTQSMPIKPMSKRRNLFKSWCIFFLQLRNQLQWSDLSNL